MSVPDTTTAATSRFAWKSDAMAAKMGWGVMRWSHRERACDVRKKRGRSKREKEETEGQRRTAERKRKREKHVEKAIEDTARKEGRRGTDTKS